jgi:hypothetical protein
MRHAAPASGEEAAAGPRRRSPRGSLWLDPMPARLEENTMEAGRERVSESSMIESEVCAECGESFPSAASLAAHQDAAHHTEADAPGPAIERPSLPTAGERGGLRKEARAVPPVRDDSGTQAAPEAEAGAPRQGDYPPSADHRSIREPLPGKRSRAD